MKTRSSLKKILIQATLLGAVGVSCWADIIDDPLHGCIIGTSCTDNGTVTPTTTNPLPTFTFTGSPHGGTGDLIIDILVPNNEDPTPAALSFSIGATLAGATDTSTITPQSSILIGDWTSSSLATFLSLNASPTNSLSDWLNYTNGSNCGATQTSPCDSGATGYEVYQVDLGNNTLQDPSNPTKPILILSGSSLPAASVLTAFLGNASTFGGSTSWIATASGGGIFEAYAPPDPAAVPEPSSIILIGTVTLGVFTLLRKKTRGCA